MTRPPSGQLMTRHCARCLAPFRVVVPVRGGQRIYCSEACSSQTRQETFHARFKRRHRGMSYKRWRVRQGLSTW